jgi:hypothetical protein
MLDGNVPENDRIKLQNIQTLFKRRIASYDKLFIQTALAKETNKWKNVFTRIVPLSKETPVEEKTFNYEGFLVANITANINNFCPLLDRLVTQGILQTPGCPEVQFEGSCNERKGNFVPSNNDWLGLEWPLNFWSFTPANNFQGRAPWEPLLVIDKPSFPNGLAVIRNVFGYDLNNHQNYFGCILVQLPDYRAKIVELKIGSRQTTIEVCVKDGLKLDIIGKLYYESEKGTMTKDVLFPELRQIIEIGAIPQSLYFYLLHHLDGELIDQREMGLWWPGSTQSKGVTVEIAAEDIRQLVGRGENDKVEFKRQIGKDRVHEFMETVVAFANGSGGVILVGIDDNGNVVGVEEEKLAERVKDLLRSYCDPPINTEISKTSVDDKSVVIIQVKEGDNKPYLLRDKGIYVRAGATDRLINTRAELDEFYEQRTQDQAV